MYLIKNGVIVTPISTFKADVLIKDGIIKEIGETIICEDAEIIDAQGNYLLPGGIDVHTHMALPVGGTVSSDDFENGTKAAAFGGITTIVDFAMQSKGQTLNEALKKRKTEADKNVYIDYGLHLAMTDLTEAVMEEMVDAIRDGTPSFKLFMTYPALAVDDFTLFNAIKKAGENGGMVEVHAENLNIITRNIQNLLSKGRTEPLYHEVSRPDYVEAEAVSRAIMWAEETKSKLYIVHLSSAKGLEKIKQSRSKGFTIISETCPQYLLLTKEKYAEENFGGAKYVMSPPLRTENDNKALWNGLKNRDIQVVGSNHCPFSMEQKMLGKESFDKIPNGVPGVETTMMLLHSEGVLKGRIDINRMAEVLSYCPAKIFGLNNKGSIEVGKDADVVIFDPKEKRTLSYKNLHTKIDYSPFEGIEVTGVPVTTMSRGRIVCSKGQFMGEKGWGKFLKRKIQ